MSDKEKRFSLIIRPCGMMEPASPKGERWKLEEMQKIVGGLIELVRVDSKFGAEMWVNEEGLILELDLNEEASKVAQSPIFGTALLVHPDHRPD